MKEGAYDEAKVDGSGGRVAGGGDVTGGLQP